jgi:hypothetical protein
VSDTALRLALTKTLELWIRPQVADNLGASLFHRPASHDGTQLAFATAKLEDCYLRVDSPTTLWVGTACFRLSDDQAQQVRKSFPALRVRHAEQPAP